MLTEKQDLFLHQKHSEEKLFKFFFLSCDSPGGFDVPLRIAENKITGNWIYNGI